MWPVADPRPHLHECLEFEARPLSARATEGFLRRTKLGTLRIPEDLIWEAEMHLESVKPQLELAV